MFRRMPATLRPGDRRECHFHRRMPVLHRVGGVDASFGCQRLYSIRLPARSAGEESGIQPRKSGPHEMPLIPLISHGPPRSDDFRRCRCISPPRLCQLTGAVSTRRRITVQRRSGDLRLRPERCGILIPLILPAKRRFDGVSLSMMIEGHRNALAEAVDHCRSGAHALTFEMPVSSLSRLRYGTSFSRDDCRC